MVRKFFGQLDGQIVLVDDLQKVFGQLLVSLNHVDSEYLQINLLNFSTSLLFVEFLKVLVFNRLIDKGRYPMNLFISVDCE